MRRKILILAVLFCTWACSDDDDSQSEQESDELPTEALQIQGSLANGVDAKELEVLKNKPVAIVRNDGVTVGEASTDDSGNFEVDLEAGALVLDSSFSLLEDSSGEKATSKDFTYRLEVEIPDDGNDKAIGIRRKLSVNKSAVSNGKLETGVNTLKEVSAIVGTVSFADTTLTAENVDVFIPGKQFFVRTGDDGSYAMLFVPPGTYKLRFVKNYYIKDVEVTVEPGKTLALGAVTVGLDDRNPGRLEAVLVGTWKTYCYYGDTGDDPKEGSLVLTSLTDFEISGSSCVLRTTDLAPGSGAVTKFSTLGDGALRVHVPSDTKILYNLVTNLTNGRIVFLADKFALPGSTQVEIWERQ